MVVAAGGTGASDGTSNSASIGAAVSLRLAAEGASVVVGDVNLEAAERTVAAVAAAGGTAVAHRFDAADDASVQALLQRAVDEFGGVDGVHSNAMDMSAGTLGVDGEHDIVSLPIEVWERTLDVGLTGFVRVIKAALPLLVARGGGGIVGTASGAVWAGEPIRVAYATTKTAMSGIMRHVATKYGRQGVRCNLVAPGMVLPLEVTSALDDAGRERLLAFGRSDKLGTPDDIAAAVTFLLSDDGAWINAQLLAVDGGGHLGGA